MKSTLTDTVEVDIEFTIGCEECGEDLDHEVTPGRLMSSGAACIGVHPCKPCLEKATKAAVEEAVEELQSELNELRQSQECTCDFGHRGIAKNGGEHYDSCPQSRKGAP